MQHVCSVAIFVCCFVVIFQERVSPVSVVSWGSAGTVLGWVFWDFWVGQEESVRAFHESGYNQLNTGNNIGDDGSSVSSVSSNGNALGRAGNGLGLSFPVSGTSSQTHSRNHSATSLPAATSAPLPVTTGHPTGAPQFASYSYYPPYNAPASPFSPRNQQRLATAKSAILIYCALLGLSPILKSLTKSTTSDSIWALSSWLMCINVFFFDYGGGVGVKYVAISPFLSQFQNIWLPRVLKAYGF